MNKFNAYKYIWNKLKENISDEDILDLMNEYESEIGRPAKNKKKKYKSSPYPLILSAQPWYRTYKLISQIMIARTKRGTIYKNFVDEFKRDFLEWTNQIVSGEKTNEELGKWLEMKHKEFQSYEFGKRQGSKEIQKPKFTESGFERKHHWELSLDEKAAIVIDELIAMFTPKVPKGFDLNVEFYRDDWEQELWTWCWEHKETDANLNTLIIKYNKLTTHEYSYRTTNILSRMNCYIVSYIAKLQYSCNDIARYKMNDKFVEEKLFPANNVHVLLNECGIDPEELAILKDRDKLVNLLFNKLEEYVPITKKSFERYKKVLEMRYGLNSKNKIYTCEEIGAYLDVSKQRVNQMEVWILQQFKEMIKAEKLEI